MDLINQNKLGNNFVRPTEPIHRLIQTQSMSLQYNKKKKSLGLNTLCRGCSSHMTLVGLLYLGRDKSETVCTGYKVLLIKGLNLLKESECRVSIQTVLCNSFLYMNNI